MLFSYSLVMMVKIENKKNVFFLGHPENKKVKKKGCIFVIITENTLTEKKKGIRKPSS